jgi:hypothetical protein
MRLFHCLAARVFDKPVSCGCLFDKDIELQFLKAGIFGF